MPAQMPQPESAPAYPVIRTLGVSGMLVSFADRLTEPANRAALAFRAAVDALEIEGVEETSSSLVSTFIRFDPLSLPHATLEDHLSELLAGRDWMRVGLPQGRRLWHIPTVYGTELAPQLEEAATEAGLTADDAIGDLSQSRVRVLTLGFAPGQPYLGPLGECWNLPRQTGLTASVPVGALVLAIRQFVLFATQAPTGWRHVGQTGFAGFRLDREAPFLLTPGDEVLFPAVSRAEFDRIMSEDRDGRGGAEAEILS